MSCLLLVLLLLNSELLFTHTANALEYSTLETYNHVAYRLYTKNNAKIAVDIRDIDVNDDYATVFVIHGFQTDSLNEPLKVKNDIFQYNPNVERVIIVTWTQYSHASVETGYREVAEDRVPRLAQDLFEKIAYIRQKGARGPIELVGHDVGAHVCGQTGKLLKQRARYTLDKIVGLDPNGRYFRSHIYRALAKDDAKNVVVIHTNIFKYGFGSEIGTNNIKANGGEIQPNCNNKPQKNLCSHNEAWNEFSLYTRNKFIPNNKIRIHPYVIALDVSDSMKYEYRLRRATQSAKKVIKQMNLGSHLGLVAFHGRATELHEIIRVNSPHDKYSLANSMPNSTNGNATSIGGGLRLALVMLKSMPNSTTFCSTIVLITDGEQNSGETPEQVLPDLEKVCVKVNTIAIGDEASSDLERISAKTDGVASYAPEDGTSEEITGTIKALTYSFEGETEKPVRLPSKHITLDSGHNEIYFTIDNTVGKDTEFSITSYAVDKIEVKLTSPRGKSYSSNDSEYFYDSFTDKGFSIKYAESGRWTLQVIRNSKSRRSIRSPIGPTAAVTTNLPDGESAILLTSQMQATAAVTTHQLDGKSAILLTADISDQVLEYPKPVTVRAELNRGKFPIIYAEVFANIQAPMQSAIRLPLRDDGIFPDKLANDGLYANVIVQLPHQERYSISVTALSNGTAMLVPKEVDYYFGNVKVDCTNAEENCIKLEPFEREAAVGSLKLETNERKDEIPPHPVWDLRVTLDNGTVNIISLEWTSPRDDLNGIQIKRYDIRALIRGIDFEKGLKFDESNVVKGSLSAINSTTDRKERISIRMPEPEWDEVVQRNLSELKIALKSIGYNDRVSRISNVASVFSRSFIDDNDIDTFTEAPAIVSGANNLAFHLYLPSRYFLLVIVILLKINIK